MTSINFGRSLPRVEDKRLITGQGAYAADLPKQKQLRVAFVRSPHASARIVGIKIEQALAANGVVAVLTGHDMSAAGVRDYSLPAKLPHVDGGFSTETPRPLMVRDIVRYLGEPVAMVLANSDALAQSAAELVEVDYKELRPISTAVEAAASGANQIWPDREGNIAFHWRKGDPEELEKVFSASARVIKLTSTVTRVAAMPMEPRSANAWIGDDGKPVLLACHQSPHTFRNQLCNLFGLQPNDIRVISRDVGGSFGMKSGLLREEAIVLWAASHLRRAVGWTATRSEAFLSDEHGRDARITAELGLTVDGIFTGLRVRYDINIGAYMSVRSSSHINNFGGIAGVYNTPAIVGEAVGYFTNTQPTAPYRGAGRPDATYAIERIIDVAAHQMGLDPIELRRRNLIPPDAMPYKTPFVFNYDCGEFEQNLDKAIELAEYSGFPDRRAAARSRGRLRGIGFAMPIELAVGPWQQRPTDYANIRANPDGTVTLFSGTMSVGQGLETALSTIIAERLGLPLERIRYLQGDTGVVMKGKGNGGSAGICLGGSAVTLGVDVLLEKARELSSRELEASPVDIEYSGGEFRIVGSDRSISLAALAAIVEKSAGEAGGVYLDGSGEFSQVQPTFPNGCHVCEVEIDPETGVTDVVNYVSVEDVGRVLNPLLMEGQIHGGVAQGIGQAMVEQICFDESGQILTGSFMDYTMPRAHDLPTIQSESLEVPTQLNPLGVKGVGEAGTVGALAATMNAICHALAPLGIHHFDMPATPYRVWQAIQQARQRDVGQ